jgi:hypothetical protein
MMGRENPSRHRSTPAVLSEQHRPILASRPFCRPVRPCFTISLGGEIRATKRGEPRNGRPRARRPWAFFFGPGLSLEPRLTKLGSTQARQSIHQPPPPHWPWRAKYPITSEVRCLPRFSFISRVRRGLVTLSANDPKRTLALGDRGEKPGVAVREEIAGSVALLARRLPPARQGVVLT